MIGYFLGQQRGQLGELRFVLRLVSKVFQLMRVRIDVEELGAVHGLVGR